jgi:hypothetical protein
MGISPTQSLKYAEHRKTSTYSFDTSRIPILVFERSNSLLRPRWGEGGDDYHQRLITWKAYGQTPGQTKARSKERRLRQRDGWKTTRYSWSRRIPSRCDRQANSTERHLRQCLSREPNRGEKLLVSYLRPLHTGMRTSAVECDERCFISTVTLQYSELGRAHDVSFLRQ